MAVDKRHVDDRHDGRSWLADQLLEPTKLVFAIVIAESLSEYRGVVTSPFHHQRYVATLALIGIYLTTVWSWRGWHAAHLSAPYVVRKDGSLPPTEIYRFYADLAIVIAYAYTLFQVAPLVTDATHDIVWLLIGYPIIVVLYLVENRLRMHSYGKGARRTIPLALTICAHAAVAGIYLYFHHKITHSASKNQHHDLLVLNTVMLSVAIGIMWCYRKFNDWYKKHYASKDPIFAVGDLR